MTSGSPSRGTIPDGNKSDIMRLLHININQKVGSSPMVIYKLANISINKISIVPRGGRACPCSGIRACRFSAAHSPRRRVNSLETGVGEQLILAEGSIPDCKVKYVYISHCCRVVRKECGATGSHREIIGGTVIIFVEFNIVQIEGHDSTIVYYVNVAESTISGSIVWSGGKADLSNGQLASIRYCQLSIHIRAGINMYKRIILYVDRADIHTDGPGIAGYSMLRI